MPIAISLAPGSYSNLTHIVIARDASGDEFRIVVRRYKIFGLYDRGEKARREFTALQCACRNGVPAPQPLYLDEVGELLGIPGIVTRYVPGSQIHSPVDPIAWAHTLAQTLAKIHAVPCDPVTRSICWMQMLRPPGLSTLGASPIPCAPIRMASASGRPYTIG